VKRRAFITALPGAIAKWPLTAYGQYAAIPTVGFLSSASRDQDGGRQRAFTEGLRETGYIEGQNVAIEYRWADEQNDRLPALAADLVSRRVSVIATSGHVLAVRAAKAATTSIPIVFLTGSDPVAAGFVESLARPGGNLTGTATLGVELEAKRLELLHGLVPAGKSVGALIRTTNPNADIQSRELNTAARMFGVTLLVVNAATQHDFDAAFAQLAENNGGSLVIATDGLFISHSEHLARLTVRHAIPAIFQYRAFAAAGGLMSYGASFADLYRKTGIYTGRILRGEKPAELPVQQTTKAELILNLRTAATLGLSVPLSLLGRADEVIE